VSESKPKIRTKRFLLAAIATPLLAVLAVALAVVLRGGSGSPVQHKTVVYEKGGSHWFWYGDNSVQLASLTEESIILFSDDGKEIYYTAPAVDGSGLYDLYYCTRPGSKNAGKKNPNLLVHGIENALEIKADGSFAYYKKKNPNGAMETWAYQRKSGRHVSVNTNIHEFFVPEQGDEVYYTKTIDGEQVLLRYAYNKPEQRLAEGVERVRVVTQKNKTKIFYEQKQSNELLSLFGVSESQNAQLIAEDVSQVLYERYTFDGNLYYFGKAKTTQADWRALIQDKNESADKLLQEPQRKDYPSLFGFSLAYNNALRAYQKKLARDDIRAALDEAVTQGTLLPGQSTLYAYDGEQSALLCEAVSPEYLYDLCGQGRPKALLRLVETEPLGIDVEDLSNTAGPAATENTVSYAVELLEKAISLSEPKLFVLQDGTPQIYDLKGYDADNTDFLFSQGGGRLYAFTKEAQGERKRINSSLLSETGPEMPQKVDIGISDYQFLGDEIWYLRPDAGKEMGGLFRWAEGNSEKIAGAVFAFLCHEDAGVLLFRNYNGAQEVPRVDIQLYDQGKLKEIDTGVTAEQVASRGTGGVTYLKDGDLYLYSSGKSVLLEKGVTAIRAF